jgi:hypothetical protein
VVHGFVRDRSGRITTFHVPFGYLHAVRDINDRDRLTPDGAIPPYTVHGFLLGNGRYQTLDAPGSLLTEAYGINDHGDVLVPEPGVGFIPVATP